MLRDACEKQRTDDEWKKFVRVVVVKTGGGSLSIDVIKAARKTVSDRDIMRAGKMMFEEHTLRSLNSLLSTYY